MSGMLKSNTSLLGMVCKDGVVMAADRRVTAGNLIMDKKYTKILYLTNNVLSSYTGSVSDAQLLKKVMTAEIRLKELKTKSKITVREAANYLALSVYRNIRNPSMIPSIVGTLVAGFDDDGQTSLYTVEPAGGVYEVKTYDANFSSGMPFILGQLEGKYRKDITVKEGVELARECIKGSIERDSGSGNGIDVFSITKDGIKHVVSEEIIPQYK